MLRVSASLRQGRDAADPVKARCVVIDGESEFLDMVVHALHISANALKFGADAVSPERDSDLRLCFFVASGAFSELRRNLGAHFLQFVEDEVFRCMFRHAHYSTAY